MRRAALTALLAAVCCLPVPPAHARDLHTRGERGAIASGPRSEYPRPQLQRASWKSLNGRWEFGFEDELEGDILVPFTFEAPLSGIGREREVHERVRYRRTFTVPRAWSGRRLLLNFGAVDHEAEVRVNGVVVGRHTGGYTPFSIDVTAALRSRRVQTLDVVVNDPARGATQPVGKQRAAGRIFYTRATGIWQSVWFEPVRGDHVADLRLRPDLDRQQLGVEAVLSRAGATDAHITVARRGATVATATTPITGSAAATTIPIPNVQPWWPTSPALYDVTVK